MVETKPCPKCGGTSYHNLGISKKTGNKYENWKCKDCQEIEWVGQKKTTYEKLPDKNPQEEVMEALRKVYAKLLEIEKLYGQQ